MAATNILLVEDNLGDARLLREYLLDAGADHYQVHHVSRLSEAIAHLAAHSIDIVLLDLGLPDSQGLDSFYRLHAASPNIPVILLTGLQDEQAAATAVQAGAQDYLQKNELNQALLERSLRYAIERQRSRLALQSSEQRLRKIIDQNSVAIFVVNTQGLVLFTNPAAAALFGHSIDDLLGKEFGYPIPIGERVEIKIVNSNSRQISAEMEAVQISWEDQPASLVSLHDITARKEAESALLKTSERLSDTLESISDGFLTLDQNLVITYYNQAAARLLNRPVSEVLNRCLFEAFPELHGTLFSEEDVLSLFKSHQPVSIETYIDISPFENWYDFRIYPSGEGASIYFQVTTERKRAEEERQWEAKLNSSLSELYKPLISPDASLTDIVAEVLQRACQLTRSKGGFITSFAEDGTASILASMIERNDRFELAEEMETVQLPRDSSGNFSRMWGLFLNAREPVIGKRPKGMTEPKGMPENHMSLDHYLAVPVKLGDRLVGQVAVINSPDGYTNHDLSAIQRLAEFYGLAIQRWEVENALRKARDESQWLFQSEHEQRELAETMRDVVSLLVTAQDQDTIFRRLLEQVSRVVPFDEAVIYLLEGENIRAVQWLNYERYHQGDSLKQVFPVNDFPNLRFMIETGQAVINPDTYHHPNWVVVPSTAHIRSYAAVPIRVQEQVIGFLNVHSTIPGFYTQLHLDRLAIFGDEVAIALENARLLEETRKRVSELEMINKVSSGLRTAETLDHMLPVFIDSMLEVLATQDGAVFLADPVTKALILTVRRGAYESFTTPPLQPGQGIIGKVYQNGQTYYSPDFRTDPNSFQGTILQVPEGVRGLCIPLRTAHETFGVLVIAFKAPRQPTTDEIHLVETLVDMAGNTFHRLRLHEETQVRLQYLSALRTVDMAIATSFDLRVTLNVLLEQALTQLSVDAADILLYNPILQNLEYAASRGFYSRSIEQTHLRIGQGFAGQAALEGRMVFVADLRERNVPHSRFLHLSGERFVTYLGVPLIIKGEIKGVLELFQRSLYQPTDEWKDFLDSLSRQAAIAIDSAQLFENLQHSRLELAMAYDYTLEGWARALDLRDKETEHHTERVVEASVKLARRLGFNEPDLVHVRRGALLHDIGKMGVPDGILLKQGPLDEQEWKKMRQHPVYALELLSHIDYLAPALDIPYCHHEHWDGEGYPRGLKGEQIPKAARIFAVVDVWDALSNDRVYRKAWPMKKVIDYLREQKGKQFDPRVVDEFIRMLEEEAMTGEYRV